MCSTTGRHGLTVQAQPLAYYCGAGTPLRHGGGTT